MRLVRADAVREVNALSGVGTPVICETSKDGRSLLMTGLHSRLYFFSDAPSCPPDHDGLDRRGCRFRDDDGRASVRVALAHHDGIEFLVPRARTAATRGKQTVKVTLLDIVLFQNATSRKVSRGLVHKRVSSTHEKNSEE